MSNAVPFLFKHKDIKKMFKEPSKPKEDFKESTKVDSENAQEESKEVHKDILLKICSITNRYVSDLTKGMVCYSESDLMEISMNWTEEECTKIVNKMQELLKEDKLLYDTQISPWCLKIDINAAVPRRRFFKCNLCRYGKRNCLCEYNKNQYTKIVKKLYYYKIFEIPGLQKELKRSILQ